MTIRTKFFVGIALIVLVDVALLLVAATWAQEVEAQKANALHVDMVMGDDYYGPSVWHIRELGVCYYSVNTRAFIVPCPWEKK